MKKQFDHDLINKMIKNAQHLVGHLTNVRDKGTLISCDLAKATIQLLVEDKQKL
jgi:hypothetical protein